MFLLCGMLTVVTLEEEFEDTNVVIRIRISKKNRQHNDQKEKYKRKEMFLWRQHLYWIIFLFSCIF